MATKPKVPAKKAAPKKAAVKPKAVKPTQIKPAAKTPVAVKIPAKLGACGDLYISTRDARLALQKQVDALQEKESVLREHLINHLPKSDATGVRGKLGSVSVTTKAVPQVQDWDKFYAHIAKNAKKGGFALLNRAVNAGAVKEIWESGKEVPGVKSFTAVSLSISKN